MLWLPGPFRLDAPRRGEYQRRVTGAGAVPLLPLPRRPL